MSVIQVIRCVGEISSLLLLLTISQGCEGAGVVRETSVNLAIRRTVDLLLKDTGDSISQIPPVVRSAAGTWRVRVERPFDYNLLPEALQASFDMYHVEAPYEVALRRCLDDNIALGYHKLDLQSGGSIPCQERAAESDCYTVEVIFPDKDEGALYMDKGGWALCALLIFFLGWLLVRLLRQGRREDKVESGVIILGNSTLDLTSQVLNSGGKRYTLTFREAKLLHVFVIHIDQVVERGQLLQSVWGDEGVQVSRSLDVFVSRLRKKISNDDSISIVAVHGIGYRLQRSIGN